MALSAGSLTLEAFGGKAAHHNFPHMLGMFKVSNICALCMLSILLNFQDLLQLPHCGTNFRSSFQR
jgi:hypothetical protein